MGMKFLLPILLSLLSAAAIPYRHAINATSAPLQPNQIGALRSMNIPISTSNPCSDPSLLCDDDLPFRHIISLGLHNCPHYLSLSSTSLQYLSTITTLELINCPFNSHINSTPLSLILDSLKNLTALTISYSNLNESLPDKWGNLDLTHIDLSNNQLEGKIPKSMEDLGCLKTLSLEYNSLYGDIPSFIRDMKKLRYLNLENNKFNNDNVSSDNSNPQGYSTTVGDMAYALSTWIFVIVIVMLIANCSL